MRADGITDQRGVPFHESKEALLLADDAGRYVDCNEAALGLLEYSRDDLLRLRPADLMAQSEFAPREWHRFLAAGEAAGFYRMRTASGTFIELHVYSIANAGPGLHLAILTPPRAG